MEDLGDLNDQYRECRCRDRPEEVGKYTTVLSVLVPKYRA